MPNVIRVHVGQACIRACDIFLSYGNINNTTIRMFCVPCSIILVSYVLEVFIYLCVIVCKISKHNHIE